MFTLEVVITQVEGKTPHIQLRWREKHLTYNSSSMNDEEKK
jgi:hypothetical protein